MLFDSDESVEQLLMECQIAIETTSEADSICYPEPHHSCTGKEPHSLGDGYGFYGYRFKTSKLFTLSELSQILDSELKTELYSVLSFMDPYCLNTVDEISIEPQQCKFHGTTYITVSRGGYPASEDKKWVSRVRKVADLVQRVLAR